MHVTGGRTDIVPVMSTCRGWPHIPRPQFTRISTLAKEAQAIDFQTFDILRCRVCEPTYAAEWPAVSKYAAILPHSMGPESSAQRLEPLDYLWFF